jgi:FAD synthase
MDSLFEIEGKVTKGMRRGKQLGFPTANVLLEFPVPEGIYAAATLLDGKKYMSVFFAGVPRTFDEKNFTAETYIIGFDSEIYGKTIKIEVFKKLRENLKFKDSDSLVAQMKKDEEEAIRFFSKSTLDFS